MNEVMVTRPGHPLDGLRLQVIGAMRKCGRDELLVVLPDGSKTLMAAAWTDHDRASAGQSRADQATAILAASADLLDAHRLVGILRVRAETCREQAAWKSPCKEDDRAACPAEFDTGTDPGATTGGDRVAARGTGRRSGQGPGPTDRAGRHSGDDGSGQ